jgi:hypothetical protein
MRLFVLALLGSFLGILGSAGCSSGGGTPACSTTFTSCGGDLTGTWTYATSCNSGSVASAGCPAATSTNVSSNISGTYTFNSDKTYAIDATVAETATVTVPASCLVGGETCSDLKSDQTADGVTIKETCTGTTDCTCQVSISGTLTQTGTWATAGNSVVITPKGSQSSSPAAYCVSGNQLEVSGGIMGNPSANAYAIFTM